MWEVSAQASSPGPGSGPAYSGGNATHNAKVKDGFVNHINILILARSLDLVFVFIQSRYFYIVY